MNKDRKAALSRISYVFLVLVTLLIVGMVGCTNKQPNPKTKPPTPHQQTKESKVTELTLATTTSTQDSGLLDVLIPAFEQQSEPKVKVKVIAVGTGQALQLGKDGNADVLLVHARKSEDEFMAQGLGENAWDVMYNQFLLVGPANDPAQVSKAKDTTDATNAFTKIANAKATFVSRGDDSGTHKKELSIWEKASIKPQGSWYVAAGQGMGETLRIAQEKNAYTLVDEASYLTNKTNLRVLLQGDKQLLNSYGIIQVKSSKQKPAGEQLINYVVGQAGQQLIGNFGKDKYGKSIFTPNAKRR